MITVWLKASLGARPRCLDHNRICGEDVGLPLIVIRDLENQKPPRFPLSHDGWVVTMCKTLLRFVKINLKIRK
jgi:hypothetical protein